MEFFLSFLLVELIIVMLILLPARVGSAWIMQGQFRQALPVFRAYHLFSRILPRWRGPTLINLCACHVGLGDYERAQHYAEAAVRESGKRKQKQSLATARAYLGLTLLRQGAFEEAGELFDLALAQPLAARLRPHIEALAAHAYLNLDRLADAYQLLHDLQKRVPEGSELAIVVQSNLSWYYGLQERWEEARETALLASARPTHRQDVRASVRMMNVICATEMGDLETAQAEGAQLMPMLPELDAYRRGGCLRAMAQLALRQGDLDRARDLAERAAPVSLNPNAQADLHLIQAEVFAVRHNAHRARALCDEILRSHAADFYKRRARRLQMTLPALSTLPALRCDAALPVLPAFASLPEISTSQQTLRQPGA